MYRVSYQASLQSFYRALYRVSYQVMYPDSYLFMYRLSYRFLYEVIYQALCLFIYQRLYSFTYQALHEDSYRAFCPSGLLSELCYKKSCPQRRGQPRLDGLFGLFGQNYLSTDSLRTIVQRIEAHAACQTPAL
jgi:hypothetical protein